MICGVSRDHHVLHTGVHFYVYFTFHFKSIFEGWLTALCRPQERGRQCVVNALPLSRFFFVQVLLKTNEVFSY